MLRVQQQLEKIFWTYQSLLNAEVSLFRGCPLRWVPPFSVLETQISFSMHETFFLLKMKFTLYFLHDQVTADGSVRFHKTTYSVHATGSVHAT